MYNRDNEKLNYLINHSTNAFAELFNAKIKQFTAQLRGIIDEKFLLFKLTKSMLNPHIGKITLPYS